MDTSKFNTYFEIGKRDLNWYAVHQNTFVELFGEDRLPLVSKLFAATSINSSLKSNIRLFRKALYEIDNGLPIGNYLPGIQAQLQRIREGRALSGRKITAFAAAMSGDINAVVVDVWLLRAFGLDRQYRRNTGVHEGKLRSGGATDRQTDLITSYVQGRAYFKGLEPRQVSAAIWSGCRVYWSGDRTTTYDELLRLQTYSMYD